MDTTEIRMTTRFLQLGLPADNLSIEQFIARHQLPEETALFNAPFWNEGQLQFLRESLLADDDRALVVDALNESLHQEAVNARNTP
jgi:hypothetical protein